MTCLDYESIQSQVDKLDLPQKVKLKNSISTVGALDYRNASIALCIDSEIELATRTISCRKEPEIVDWIENVIAKFENPVFYDIGANVGAYSLVASVCTNRAIVCYAFEPSFLNYYQLNKNILLNSCESCILPLNIALSDENKLDLFHYSSMQTGAAAHAFGNAVGETGEVFEPVCSSLARSYRLDDLVKHFGFEMPNFVKIDVDGIEMKVLKGAENVLASDELKGLVLEIIYESDAEVFFDYLKKFGFSFVSKHAYTGKSPGFNYIFEK